MTIVIAATGTPRRLKDVFPYPDLSSHLFRLETSFARCWEAVLRIREWNSSRELASSAFARTSAWKWWKPCGGMAARLSV